jgi:two-component system, LytTR family, sensor kinase
VIAPEAAEVLNLVGFVTGAVLYAMLLGLVVRDARGRAGRGSSLPLATALLGLMWNAGELAAYVLPRIGVLQNSVGLWAASFPALGFLAAVVVHSVARELPRGGMVIVGAYACSAAASVLHVQTVISGNPDASFVAFALLTICYGVIIVALAVLSRGQANGPRAFWVLALAVFAVSASHLGRTHTEGQSWVVELVGHHAAIPLAFAILYQDYRFALGDLFLKRALTLLVLVAIAFAGYSLVVSLPAGPFASAVLLALWVATAWMVPWLHRGIARFVDATLLGRLDYGVLRSEITAAIESEDSTDGVLNTVCERLQIALNAARVSSTLHGDTMLDAAMTTQATIPTTEKPRYSIGVGELMGGRKLLSDDLALIETVSAIAARRIDQIRLTAERYEHQLREEEMLKLTAEAELKALRAQINPHFLFNALTTIGYLIESAPPRALATLMQLTALLRGVLRSDGEFTTLGRELELIEHYLQIERERFEERLTVSLDVPLHLRSYRIPSLVLQPLVENAIKHGIGGSVTGGVVEVRAEEIGDSRLRVMVRNSGAPLRTRFDPARGEHLGVDNVMRRLRGHFGDAATFALRTDGGFTVAEMILPRLSGPGTKDERYAEIVARRAGGR